MVRTKERKKERKERKVLFILLNIHTYDGEGNHSLVFYVYDQQAIFLLSLLFCTLNSTALSLLRL
jgi:hypothetical protein